MQRTYKTIVPSNCFEDEMSNDCIGTISELYDSSPPFTAHGAYSFAMSVAELLRAMKLMKEYTK